MPVALDRRPLNMVEFGSHVKFEHNIPDTDIQKGDEGRVVEVPGKRGRKLDRGIHFQGEPKVHHPPQNIVVLVTKESTEVEESRRRLYSQVGRLLGRATRR